MRSFAAQANVFLVKAASSQRQAGADGLVSSGGRKCPAGEIQVCERQQREHLGSVLGDATIAHLAIAELALHDTKHMARLSRAPCRTYDCEHAGGPSACRRVWPSPSPPKARRVCRGEPTELVGELPGIPDCAIQGIRAQVATHGPAWPR